MRDRIGRVGAWLGVLGWTPAAEAREAVAEIEGLGYGAIWVAEGHNGKEAFANASIVLGATSRLVVATGIANVWVRDATAMVAASNTLAEAFPRRFLLGVGVSHPPQIEPRGHDYARPMAKMRRYLDEMDAVDFTGPQPPRPVERVLAALRPPMLELARDRSSGAHPYFVPPEHTRRAREILGPEPLLATEQAVVLETDPAKARAAARSHMEWYLTLPNYTENLRWLGFGDDDFQDGGSDRLADAIVAWGDEEAIASRVAEHLEAGADHVCLQPLPPGGGIGLELLRRLAPACLAL